jgi:chemotaxis protein MotA
MVEITSIFGIILAVACLLIAFIMDGGHFLSLFAPSAALIVFGGTIGATVTSYSKEELTVAAGAFRMFFYKSATDKLKTLEDIILLAERARREGILYLENYLEQIEDKFLQKGIQLIVDGTNPELLRAILETEIYMTQEKQDIGAGVFETAGGYAPTMGIIGTVMGLVHVLGNLSEPDKLGPSIAMAFLATLYGVGSANVLWLPIAAKIRNTSKQESVLREMMLEGLVSIQAGNNPILIREKLVAFLGPKEREGSGKAKEVEADE